MHVNLLIYEPSICHHTWFIPQKFLSTFTPSLWTQRNKCNSSFTRPTLWLIFLPLLSNFSRTSLCIIFLLSFSPAFSPLVYKHAEVIPIWKYVVSLTLPLSLFPAWSLTSPPPKSILHCTVSGPQKCPTNICWMNEWTIQFIMFPRRVPSPLLPWHCCILVLLPSLWSFSLSPFFLIL